MHGLRRSILLFFAAGFVIIGGALPVAAGGGGHGGPCDGFTETSEISMRDFCFSGVATFIEGGDDVVVSNDGEVDHDFTAVDDSFASGLLEPGDAWTLTADLEPGVYRYYCTLHGSPDGLGMAGVLVVGGAGASGLEAGSANATDESATGGAAQVASDDPVAVGDEPLRALLAASGAALDDERPLSTASLTISVVALGIGAVAIGASLVLGLDRYRTRRTV